ncbi:MAG: hypothetical protein HY321_09865 [Armatimonadetes bacterium]|nr:hypothetical protein [Armatimonadota bacterium]
MKNRWIYGLLALATVAGAGGCYSGGATGRGPDLEVRRAIVGRCRWPADLGAVSSVQVQLRELRSGGVSAPVLAGTFDAATAAYSLVGVPGDRTLLVEAAGSTTAGSPVRLRALVLPEELSGSRAAGADTLSRQTALVQDVTLTRDMTSATTIAAEAVVALVERGLDPNRVTPALVDNINAASQTEAPNTNVADPNSLDQAVQRVLGDTNQGNQPPSVVVTPSQVTVSAGKRVRFTALDTGAQPGVPTAFVWSIREGETGGAISMDGLYTAPGDPGVYHVVATSAADPNRFGMATVVVDDTSGTGAITIR